MVPNVVLRNDVLTTGDDAASFQHELGYSPPSCSMHVCRHVPRDRRASSPTFSKHHSPGKVIRYHKHHDFPGEHNTFVKAPMTSPEDAYIIMGFRQPSSTLRPGRMAQCQKQQQEQEQQLAKSDLPPSFEGPHKQLETQRQRYERQANIYPFLFSGDIGYKLCQYREQPQQTGNPSLLYPGDPGYITSQQEFNQAHPAPFLTIQYKDTYLEEEWRSGRGHGDGALMLDVEVPDRFCPSDMEVRKGGESRTTGVEADQEGSGRNDRDDRETPVQAGVSTATAGATTRSPHKDAFVGVWCRSMMRDSWQQHLRREAEEVAKGGSPRWFK